LPDKFKKKNNVRKMGQQGRRDNTTPRRWRLGQHMWNPKPAIPGEAVRTEVYLVIHLSSPLHLLRPWPL
jgi:hypothetical protein